MTSDLAEFLHGVPVVGFPVGDFAESLNGAPFVDQGGVTVQPYSCKCATIGNVSLTGTGALSAHGPATCTASAYLLGLALGSSSIPGACKGSALLTGKGALAGHGYGGCTASVSLTAKGAMVTKWIGTCTASALLTGTIPPPISGTWYLRRISPTPCIVREMASTLPFWDRTVSPTPPRQRQIKF
jgi:hypothetical protein